MNVKKEMIVSENVELEQICGKFQSVMKMENADALNVKSVWIVGIFARRGNILNATRVDASAVQLILNPKNVLLIVIAKDVELKERLVLAKMENAFV